MKAIIYAGIGLFSAASVYGVIDYYGAKKQGVLNNLYKEDAPDAAIDAKETTKKATAVLSNAVAVNTPAVAVAKVPLVKTKKAKMETRFVKFSDFSRGAIIRTPMPVVAEVPIPVPKPEPAVTAAAVEITASTSAEKVEEKKETIIEQPVKREPVNLKMFSRAPLKKKIRKEVPEKVTQQ